MRYFIIRCWWANELTTLCWNGCQKELSYSFICKECGIEYVPADCKPESIQFGKVELFGFDIPVVGEIPINRLDCKNCFIYHKDN